MRTCPRALLSLALVGSLIPLGCQPPQNSTRTLPPGPPPKTIISLSPGATELTSYVVYVKLIGHSAADTYPREFLKEQIVANVKPDYELIGALKPDLIIYDQDLFSPAEIDKVKQSAPSSKVMEITGNTVDEFIKSLYRVGTFTLCETSFSEYIDRIKNVQTVCKSEPITPRPKTALVMTMPNANPMVAGVNSFYADLDRTAGADPVGPNSTKFETMSVEALVALNPDIIIVAGKGGDYTSLTKDPRMAQLTAVKKNKVFGIDADFVLRRGARVETALTNLHKGLVALSK